MSWIHLDDGQVALLSEGFCPWGRTNPHRMGCAEVLRDEELVEYGYCILQDALARAIENEPEVLPVEAIGDKGWRLVKWGI